MNGAHFSQLGRLEEGCDSCLATRAAGRTEGEMAVLMTRSFILGLERPPWPGGFVVPAWTVSVGYGLRVPVLALRMALCLRNSARRRTSQGFS